MNHSKLFAVLALTTFALLSAVRDVWASKLLGSTLTPEMYVLAASIVTFVVFYVIASVSGKKLYAFDELRTTSSGILRQVLFLNVGTLTAFLTTFQAITKLDPYVNSLFDYGGSPLVATLLAVSIRKETVPPRAWIWMIFGLAGVIVLAVGMVTGSTSRTQTTVEGIILALVSLVAMCLNNIWSKNIVTAGITRGRLLVARFPVTILGLAAYTLLTNQFVLTTNAPLLLLNVVMGFAIPLYLIAYSFERLNAVHVAYALMLIPVFTFVGNSIVGNSPLTDTWLYILAGVMVLISVYMAEIVTPATQSTDTST